MANNNQGDALAEIRKNLETKKLVLGTERTVKGLRLGKLQKVYLTKNCAATVRQDVEHYSKISKIEIVDLPIENDELGTVCRKPFKISAVGLLKA